MKLALYLGLEKPEDEINKTFIHYPVIQIVPDTAACKAALNSFSSFTHLIFTSKTAVKLFFNILEDPPLHEKIWIAVGKATEKALKSFGIEQVLTPEVETAEGIVSLLKTLPLEGSHFFWPHSALSRPILRDFFLKENLIFEECILYDTLPFWPGYTPDFNAIDEIIFTSSSTVDAFFLLFPNLHLNQTLTPIGPITKAKLTKKLCINSWFPVF